MRDGRAWSGSESDAVNAPSPFKDSSTALEHAFGLYEAAFCATAQLLPDVDSVRATLPPSEGPVNVFEKQDSTTQMDCVMPAPPPLKRSRHSPFSPAELVGHRGRLSRSSNTNAPQEPPDGEQPSQRSSSEDCNILPQHHNSALCVC